MKQLGHVLVTRRKELNLTQKELAEKIHVSNKAISKWENGHGYPDITNLETLARALEIDVEKLLFSGRAKRNIYNLFYVILNTIVVVLLMFLLGLILNSQLNILWIMIIITGIILSIVLIKLFVVRKTTDLGKMKYLCFQIDASLVFTLVVIVLSGSSINAMAIFTNTNEITYLIISILVILSVFLIVISYQIALNRLSKKYFKKRLPISKKSIVVLSLSIVITIVILMMFPESKSVIISNVRVVVYSYNPYVNYFSLLMIVLTGQLISLISRKSD